jgi:cytokinesis protein
MGFQQRNVPGYYEYLFRSLESALLGSLVGASEEVRKGNGHDSSFQEYAVRFLYLPSGLVLIAYLVFAIVRVMDTIEDMYARLHHRSLMDSAGLLRIIILCHEIGTEPMEAQLDELRAILEDDELRLRERYDQEILRDLRSTEDIWNTIRRVTDNTDAKEYFLSMMRHLLLIQEESPDMVGYYRFMDSLVRDVVMDRKLGTAERRLGHSVQRLIAQLNDAQRYQTAIEEAAEARSQALSLKLEKEALEEEMLQGHDGLAGNLKAQVALLEQKLNSTRETTKRLQGQLETQKTGYEEQIAQLEAQIMELFRMLKEAGKGYEKILDSNSGTMDQKNLIENLNKYLERSKTISILEGRGKKKKDGNHPDGEDDEDDPSDDETTPRNSDGKRGASGRSKLSKAARISGASNTHESQFMDADEADEREQTNHQLVANAKFVRPFQEQRL